MNKIITLLLLILFINFNISESKKNNILKDYVEKVDPNYKYTLNTTYDIGFSNVYVLELISQQWMKNYTTDSIWRHWVYVCVPKNYEATHETALLYINGGSVKNWATPSQTSVQNNYGVNLCKQTNAISVTVNQVPNEYITMDDGVARTEDGIVAYSWRKFIDTKDSDWISLLPQTKASTSAMTAAQQFGSEINVVISKFVVAGASKRGWTTYGVAMAEDPRVAAIIPMVIGVPNLVEALTVQVPAYGNWSYALDDYAENGIPSFINTQYFTPLADIVDPINYSYEMEKIPKYIMLSVLDEFFLPDSTKFFFNKFNGQKRLGLFQVNHGINSLPSVATQIADYFNLTVNKQQVPELSWLIDYSEDNNTGTIYMNIIKGTPTSVKVYSVDSASKTKRDFRYTICDDGANCVQSFSFKTYPINITSNDSYSFTLSKPTDGGWTAFYFEVQFNNVTNVNTELAVVPNFYPFPECSTEICASGIPKWVTDSSNSTSSSSNSTSSSDINSSTDGSESSDDEINISNTIKTSSLFIILLINIIFLF